MPRAYTMGGAIQLGIQEEVGSLAVGKYADPIVLDRNLHEIPATGIQQAQVLLTMMDGMVRRDEGVVRRADE